MREGNGDVEEEVALIKGTEARECVVYSEYISQVFEFLVGGEGGDLD